MAISFQHFFIQTHQGMEDGFPAHNEPGKNPGYCHRHFVMPSDEGNGDNPVLVGNCKHKSWEENDDDIGPEQSDGFVIFKPQG